MSVLITVAGGSIAEIIAALSGHSLGSMQGGFSTSVIPDDDGDDSAPLNTAAPAIDADGVPWDSRIHSDNKQTTAKGVWRKRKNIDDATYKAITAELKARATVAGNYPMPNMSPPSTGIPAGTPMLPAPAINQPVFTGQPVSMPAPPPQLSPQPQQAGMSFGEFMAGYSQALQAGRVTEADTASIYQWQGISDISQLANDPVRIKQVFDWLRQYGKV